MPAASTYEAIATYTATAAISDYTFSSIPSTYTDLVLILRTRTTSSGCAVAMRFNGSSTSNYTWNYMSGNGTSMGAGFSGPSSYGPVGWSGNFGDTQSLFIVNINSYSSGTDRFKSWVSRSGSATTQTELLVGAWSKDPKATISEINLFPTTGNFVTGTNITIYGIKAA
jgi:hypothetical protein